MATTPEYIDIDRPTNIGYEGEKNAKYVVMPIPRGWDSSDTILAIFNLPGTNLPIPYDITIEGHSIIWQVTEYAVSKHGAGKLQFVVLHSNNDINDYRLNGEITIREKTEVFETWCEESVGQTEPVTPTSPTIDKIIALVEFFGSPLPARVANKYLGTDSDNKWVFKDGGSSTASLIFAESRPATPIADALYAIGSHDNYILEAYHDGQWETFSGTTYPEYTGSYEFTPSTTDEQTGATQGHFCSQNITVHKIPRADVDNPAGGKTTTIG